MCWCYGAQLEADVVCWWYGAQLEADVGWCVGDTVPS